MKTSLPPQALREIMLDYRLSIADISKTLNIPMAWLSRVMVDSEKYSFINPNPERMLLITNYLLAYKEFQDSWNRQNSTNSTGDRDD